jgi:SAM-dependent methyltransferase
MRYYESYEKIYSKGLSQMPETSPSLLEFYSQEIKIRLPKRPLNILDIGCGAGSIFKEIEGDFEVLGVDVSPSAIKLANQNNNFKNIKYESLDVTRMNFKEQFDLVFDSHCFHCLTDSKDREKALSNIYQSLKPGGIFALETMTSHKLMSFENPYYFEDNILYRLNKIF